ncbi:MAG: deoxyribodipyrimidine photo-lyase [Chitinispirillaceae bacterium]
MIQSERIKQLNSSSPSNGAYVLYWMQQSQRTIFNHALEHAAYLANQLNKPLIVFFGVTPSFPDGNRRHYHFMLQGLPQIKNSLQQRGIQMVVRICELPEEVIKLARNASAVVTDAGYLRFQRSWRETVALKSKCPVIQVESDVVVPVETASQKEETGARTLRPKIMRLLPAFLIPLKQIGVRKDSLGMNMQSIDISDPAKVLGKLKIDQSVKEVKWLRGGQQQAQKTLSTFIHHNLEGFAKLRNDPSLNHLSNLSPYLHFGQISPLQVALEVLETDFPDKDAFIEEMVVRRELSMNFIHYNPHYDSFQSIPGWARATLSAHAKDKRPVIYSLKELESARTYDEYWNAAQREMNCLGKMHGYMRMYWGKKILEWSPTPQEAFRRTLYLDNKYFVDGRDPNGFTGVAWCFGKHDRAWTQRSVFGKVRYMNANGLRRKYHMQDYIDLVQRRIEEESGLKT